MREMGQVLIDDNINKCIMVILYFYTSNGRRGCGFGGVL